MEHSEEFLEHLREYGELIQDSPYPAIKLVLKTLKENGMTDPCIIDFIQRIADGKTIDDAIELFHTPYVKRFGDELGNFIESL